MEARRMNQLGLDFAAPENRSDRAFARNSDPDTSHAAARRVTPKIQRLERQVIDALRLFPDGLTVHGISAATGLDKWSVSPRMKPLEKKGLVRRLSERRERATVWMACQ